jgi:hypothetical protein
LVILEIGSLIMPHPTMTKILLFVLLYVSGVTGMCHNNQPLVQVGSHELYFGNRSWTLTPPISISWVARITGVSHQAQL